MRNPIANVAKTTRTLTAAAVLNDDIPPMAMEATGWANSSWPISPNDIIPLEWWRTMPADHLGDAHYLLLRATMGKIVTMHGREWLTTLRSDDTACVAIAFGALPVTEVTLAVDLAMSALTFSALEGNASAGLALSHILQQTPFDHPFARDLSLSWLALSLSCEREKTRHVKPDETGLQRAASHNGGDFS